MCRAIETKVQPKGFNSSYAFMHFFLLSFFFSPSLPFLKLSFKYQTTMDEHNTQHCYISYAYMVVSHVIIVIVTFQQLALYQHYVQGDDNGYPHYGIKWNTKKWIHEWGSGFI